MSVAPKLARRRWPCVGIALALVGLAACSKTNDEQPAHEEPSTKPAASAPAQVPNKDVLVDEGYRVQLELPGPQWRRLSPEVVPDGVFDLVGARRLSPMFMGWVTPLGRADGPVPSPASSIISNDPESVLTPVGESTRRINGTATLVATYRGPLYAAEQRYSIAVVRHAGYDFAVVGASEADTDTTEHFDEYANALTWLPGKIAPRPRDEIDGIEGVDWRIRDGVYENASTGVVLDPPTGWLIAPPVIVPPEFVADVALTHEPDRMVTLRARRVFTGDAPNFAMAQFDIEAIPKGSKTVVLKPRGTAAIGYRRVLEGVEETRVFFGFDDVSFELTSFADASNTSSREWLDSIIESIEVLDASERGRLASELPQKRERVRTSDVHMSIRNGVFRDFEQAVWWEAPRGAWELHGPGAAQTVVEGGQLLAINREHDLNLVLFYGDASQNHVTRWMPAVERVARDLGAGRFGPYEPVSLGAGIGAKSEAAKPGPPEGNEYIAIGAGANGMRPFGVLIWGAQGLRERANDAVDEAILGLYSGTELPEIVTEGRRVTDHRLGIEFELPKGFASTDLPPEMGTGVLPAGRSLSWIRGDSRITTICMTKPAGIGDDEFWIGTAADSSATGTARSNDLEIERDTWTINGHLASYATIGDNDRHQVVAVGWDHRYCTILGLFIDEAELEQIAESFRVLD